MSRARRIERPRQLSTGYTPKDHYGFLRPEEEMGK